MFSIVQVLAAESPFQIKDAISSYYRVFDVSLKVWSFYWVVAIGLLGFLWSTRRDPKLKIILIGVFSVFALGNLLVVCLTQNVLWSINLDVAAYLETHSVGGAFNGSLKALAGGLPVWAIAVVHVVVDIAVLIALCFAKTDKGEPADESS